jgi:hypothetical protein
MITPEKEKINKFWNLIPSKSNTEWWNWKKIILKKIDLSPLELACQIQNLIVRPRQPFKNQIE